MKNYLSVWAQDLEVLHPANIGSYSLKTPWTVFWVRDTIFAKAFVDNNSDVESNLNEESISRSRPTRIITSMVKSLRTRRQRDKSIIVDAALIIDKYLAKYSVSPERQMRPSMRLKTPGSMTVKPGEQFAIEIELDAPNDVHEAKPAEIGDRKLVIQIANGSTAGNAGSLPFEPNTVAINYVITAQHSTYSDGVLGLADPNDNLRKRCLSLCDCFNAFSPPAQTVACTKPYLVTPSWIEQANRIKRRLTTNGGVDDGLAEHMVECLARKPAVVESITRLIHLGVIEPRIRSWEDAVRVEVKKHCFYKNNTFRFTWKIDDSSIEWFTIDNLGKDELPDALKLPSQESSRTWLSPLAEMVPEVKKVLYCHEISLCPVLVLQLTSTHRLWRSTCYVQSHVPSR
ncbi:hypothetical protein F4825DRAFT_457191 [Nemania diffusa]|nr:hypothetical protein F4825DRAFT_457191 [Nemania diffusa]